MQIIVGSDEDTHLARQVVAELQRRGHEVTTIGPVAGQAKDWSDVGREAATGVAAGRFDMGVVMCWTGTGVSISANRVRGARAALCADAETAAGARRWNDANILVLSNRATTPAVASEILTAWLGTKPDPLEGEPIAKLDLT